MPVDGLALMEEKRVATVDVWDQLSPAGKQRAWFVTDLAEDRIARTANELLGAFREGMAHNEFLERLESLGISVTGAEMPAEGQISRAHADLLYRQNLYSGYSADRWIKAQATRETRQYGQYVTAGDERVRPEHAALDGIIKPLDDPFWAKHWPPKDFNCRCSVVTLSDIELEEEGLSVADEYEEAARYQGAQILSGSGYTQQQFDQGWKRLAGNYRDGGRDVSGMLVPGTPGWSFNRGDAFYLTSRGEGPVTEIGRRDAGLLTTLLLPSEIGGQGG